MPRIDIYGRRIYLIKLRFSNQIRGKPRQTPELNLTKNEVCWDTVTGNLNQVKYALTTISLPQCEEENCQQKSVKARQRTKWNLSAG